VAWESSDRRSELPADWATRVAAVKDRDRGQCTWKLKSGARCPRRGTDVDHRKPGSDHSLWNLQLLCAHHHAWKTAREGAAGRRRKRAPLRAPEAMPGRLR
jgi:5-methylcytosine-specific restriction protein A